MVVVGDIFLEALFPKFLTQRWKCHSVPTMTSETFQAQKSRPAGCPLPPFVPHAASAEGRKLQPSHFMTFTVWLKDFKQPAPPAGEAGHFGRPSRYLLFTSVTVSVDVMKASPSRQLPVNLLQLRGQGLQQGQGRPSLRQQAHDTISSEPYTLSMSYKLRDWEGLPCQQIQAQIQALPLASCAILSKLLNFSEPHLSYL